MKQAILHRYLLVRAFLQRRLARKATAFGMKLSRAADKTELDLVLVSHSGIPPLQERERRNIDRDQRKGR